MNKKYAVVDIETTGGSADSNGITEIAIVVVENGEIVDQFQSLVNPLLPIPPFIQNLTGIDDHMVKDAPLFDDIAEEVYDLLKDAVFVAHNVNFDYTFVQSALKKAGFRFQKKKLCTVRLSRKIWPGFKKYSLGILAERRGVQNNNAHRAMSDAYATAEIFIQLLNEDEEGEIDKQLKKQKEVRLPINIDWPEVDNIPVQTGIYYFLDQSGKPIYIGKAKNLKKRVLQHFTTDQESEQKSAFHSDVFKIKTEVVTSEFLALLKEDGLINHYWPKHNKAQKGPNKRYGIFMYTDQTGKTRLAIQMQKIHDRPLFSLASRALARKTLFELQRTFNLRSELLGLPESFDEPEVELHNEGIEALKSQFLNATTYEVMLDKFWVGSKRGYCLIKNNLYQGYGFIERNGTDHSLDSFLQALQPQKSTLASEKIIQQYRNKLAEIEVLSWQA